MSRPLPLSLFACTCAAALCAHGAAIAQVTEDAAVPRSAIGDLTDVITVTATKAENPEDVQDVPVAVTAFNASTLDALNVRDLEDLSFSSPNVSLDDIGTSRGMANFSIRGLGVNSGIASVDPAVGVFVDGIYLGINSGVVFDMFDLESVEVLRGPQGILFGRNTTGGAVLVNTGNPTDTFEAKLRYIVEGPVDADRGGINQYVMGTVSGPLVEGRLNGKLGLYVNDDRGYFENLATGGNLGAAKTKIIRGALEWFPAEDLTFLAKGELFEHQGDGPAPQNRGTFSRDSFDVSIDEVGELDITTAQLSLRADWDLGFGTVTNIFGYRDFTQDTLADIDALPVDIFTSPTQTEQSQVSNELRYAGTLGRFDIKGGLYYFEQDVAVNEVRRIVSGGSVIPNYVGGGMQNQEVYGVFGQLGYEILEDLTVTGGLRFSYEEKDAAISYVRPQPSPCDVLAGTCPTDDITTSGFRDDDAWQNLSPKIGFQWTPTADANLYGGWTRSFRSGGYNFRITDIPRFLDQVAAQTEIATDEERVDSFELGTKLEGLGGRGQLRAAAFYTRVEDMQREVNLSDPGAGVSQLLTNTADADISGIELEGQFLLTDSLLLAANLGTIDAQYDKVRFDISSDGVVDDEDLALGIPRVPELTYGASLVHETALPGARGQVTSRLSFQHRDEIAYTDNNFGWIEEADILDADITWQTPVEGLTLSLYAENLLDEVQAGGDTQLPFGGLTPAVAEDGGTGLAGPRSDLENTPFDDRPRFGTLSPLKKGRLVGFEVTVAF